MEETHVNIWSAHQLGPKLYDLVKRMEYYWPTIVRDCIHFPKRCDACQFHVDFIQQPLEPLHLIIISWPFETWGLNVVGTFTPNPLLITYKS